MYVSWTCMPDNQNASQILTILCFKLSHRRIITGGNFNFCHSSTLLIFWHTTIWGLGWSNSRVRIRVYWTLANTGEDFNQKIKRNKAHFTSLCQDELCYVVTRWNNNDYLLLLFLFFFSSVKLSFLYSNKKKKIEGKKEMKGPNLSTLADYYVHKYLLFLLACHPNVNSTYTKRSF